MNISAQSRVGLVLSGGGAKGAYQVGVAEYLAESGLKLDMISGASIGSLNGAVLSASKDLSAGAAKLRGLWTEVAKNSPIELDGVEVSLLALMTVASIYAGPAARGLSRAVLGRKDWALVRNDRVKALLDNTLTPASLRAGLPMWVSVYESGGLLADLAEAVPAIIGLGDTSPSKFLRLQELRDEEVFPALLASAAIPLAFKAQVVDGKRYVDGGMGGWKTVQGNTPITPLVDAGCTHIIVTHLNDGSLWSRHDFPGVTILEVRPSGIARDGMATDLIGFKKDSIESWMRQGHEDARRCVGEVMQALGRVHDGDVAHAAAAAAVRSSEGAVMQLHDQPFKID